MKKLIALFLLAAVLVGIVSCGRKAPGSDVTVTVRCGEQTVMLTPILTQKKVGGKTVYDPSIEEMLSKNSNGNISIITRISENEKIYFKFSDREEEHEVNILGVIMLDENGERLNHYIGGGGCLPPTGIADVDMNEVAYIFISRSYRDNERKLFNLPSYYNYNYIFRHEIVSGE